jgi:dephospho-CoA kinase
MSNQLSREEFLQFADRVIDNNGSIAEVEKQIARFVMSSSDTEPERDTNETS